MIYESPRIQCQHLQDGIVELTFNAKDESVNKFDKATLDELNEALNAIKEEGSAKGLLVTSSKEAFIVGADITAFTEMFTAPEEQIIEWLRLANGVFCKVEDLDIPSVTAINGYALGGGFEMALSTTYRIMSNKAKVGLPEVKLGIFPGFGGTVRLSRLIGADNAIEWIAEGKEYKAEQAFKYGSVDAAVAPEKLRDASLHMLQRAISGNLDWRKKRQEKLDPLTLNGIEGLMVFEGAKGFVAGIAGPHYPAPVKAITAMQKGATLGRDEALVAEAQGFAKVAKTPTASNLVSLFLGDQFLKKEAKNYKEKAHPVKSAAVLGAGIMGGGIAYQSSYKNIPIYMKDINAEALDTGMEEATKLLTKLVKRDRIDTTRMATVLSHIHPTLSYAELNDVDIIVEAVVENENIKKSVLAELEDQVRDNTVLTSNTSTISISKLAEGLKRPELFCGMHFFNPVHRMPLVEVIRGEKSSEEAVATTVAYAAAMGKTPIVVNDCPGFLVNRILMPYFAGFMYLLRDGVDFARIDKVMEKFGWPMGPAYLLDVVGIDTAHHANEVMAAGFPDRMQSDFKTALDVMFENQRFGQKNDKGFYAYSLDKKGKPKKAADDAVQPLLDGIVQQRVEVSDEEIIERLMFPMIIESARCLEDKIVNTATEVDMGLIFGIGFPPFRGGALRYADSLGLEQLCSQTERYASMSKLYEPLDSMRELAKAGKTFYS